MQSFDKLKTAHFDEQTIHDLEFTTIREWLVEYAIGPTAKKRLEELVPSNHFPSIETDLRKVNELLSIRNDGESFPALDFERSIIIIFCNIMFVLI